MTKEIKNNILFIISALIIGITAGIVVWLFMSIMNLGIEFLWEYIPNKFDIPFYTILICLIGGLLIGLWNKRYGKYPEEMDKIMLEVKKKKRYEYNNLIIIFVSALLPIILGASIGPEAGLVGIIAGVCTWIGDKFKFLTKERSELSSMGLSATLSAIFGAPLFGMALPIEDEGEKLPKSFKLAVYFVTVLGAFLAIKLLGNIYSGGGLPNFYDVNLGTDEYVGLIFLSLIGIIAGYLFYFSKIITKKLAKLVKSPVVLGIIAGIILGVCGTLLPNTMFSGEEQATTIKNNFITIGASALILTSIIKLIITNLCNNFGLKGGHFFPVIFSGISLGYGLSILTNLDPIFCVIIVTTSLVSFVMKKPIATILLLMMFFPPVCLIPMIIAATIPQLFPIPKEKTLH